MEQISHTMYRDKIQAQLLTNFTSFINLIIAVLMQNPHYA